MKRRLANLFISLTLWHVTNLTCCFRSLAIALVNNANGTATVRCDAHCFKALADASGLPVTAGPYKATDLWSAEGNMVVIDVAAGGFNASVPGGGASRIFKLTTSA